MKKNLFKTRFLTMLTASFVLGLVALTGCSKKSQMNSLVPKDAAVVLCADLNSLWDKGDFDHIDQIDMVNNIRKELRDENSKAADILDELLKDPNSCGLKLKGDMVLFCSNSLKSPVCLGVFMKKAKKFEKFLDNISNEFDVDIDISKKDDFKFTYIDGAAICWNSKKAYLLGGVSEDDAEDDAKTLMAMKKDNTMATNADFTTLMKEPRDFRFFVNSDNLIEYIQEKSPRMYRQYKEIFEQNQSCSSYLSLNFEKGSIKMETKSLGIDPDKKGLRGDFDSKLLDYLPSETFGATTLALDMDFLINELEKTGKIDLNERIDRNGPSIKNLLKCLTGDFAVNLSNIKYDRYDGLQPVLSVVTGISNSRTIEKILDGMEENGNLEYYDGSYRLSGSNFYIKLKNNVLLFSNEQKALKSFERGGNGDGLSNIASEAVKGNYFYFNLNTDDYPSSVLKEALGREVVGVLSGLFENIEAKTTSDFGGELTINFKDKDTNSLEFLIKYLDTLSRFM